MYSFRKKIETSYLLAKKKESILTKNNMWVKNEQRSFRIILKNIENPTRYQINSSFAQRERERESK